MDCATLPLRPSASVKRLTTPLVVAVTSSRSCHYRRSAVTITDRRPPSHCRRALAQSTREGSLRRARGGTLRLRREVIANVKWSLLCPKEAEGDSAIGHDAPVIVFVQWEGTIQPVRRSAIRCVGRTDRRRPAGRPVTRRAAAVCCRRQATFSPPYPLPPSPITSPRPFVLSDGAGRILAIVFLPFSLSRH